MEPVVQAALLGGATQLLLLDRVPDHAVLDESVEWVKSAGRPKAAGLVNAVLRKTIALRGQVGGDWDGDRDAIPLADGTALWLTKDALPQDELKRLADATSMPATTLRGWANAWDVDRAHEQALHTLTTPATVVHTAHATEPVEPEPGLAPHRSAAHRVFVGEPGSLGPLLDRRRDLWVQDEASCKPVRVLHEIAETQGLPATILDLCAGQGTKTRHLAAVFAAAQILATDTDETRLRTLRRTFAEHDRVTVQPHAQVLEGSQGWAEAVLLDVPCSNSGVLPRRVEARYRGGTGQLGRMIAVQREILQDAVGLLKPGGLVLYATCSLEREENEDQAVWAVESLGLRLATERRTWPTGLPGEGPEEYRDGSYAAVLAKPN